MSMGIELGRRMRKARNSNIHVTYLPSLLQAFVFILALILLHSLRIYDIFINFSLHMSGLTISIGVLNYELLTNVLAEWNKPDSTVSL